jgi:hypothetical protein
MDGGAHGLLSADPAVSPLAGWSKAHINYCDGGSYSGNTSTLVKETDKLEFRGVVILEQVSKLCLLLTSAVFCRTLDGKRTLLAQHNTREEDGTFGSD